MSDADGYGPLLATICARAKVDVVLVRAQILVESGGHPWAFNPEPAYRYLWNCSTHAPFRPVGGGELASKVPPKDFPGGDCEWWGQQMSWGLMQVMGALAREKGFRGAFLSALCDPTLNLTIGCGHLADLLRWAHGNAEQALAAYNGGKAGNRVPPFRNRAYARKVLGARAS